MRISAGLLIRYKDNILLCKSKGDEKSNWAPPKGNVEKGETLIQAAIRETYEEIGIYIDPSKINKEPIKFEYVDKKTGEFYKTVWIFIVDIKDLMDIRLNSKVVPKDQLQEKEITWAGFLNKKEASKVIFHRFERLLDYI